MSRYRGPRVKILRALGADLPGLTVKSSERRPYPPGQHGHQRRKLSEYAVRVMETKKLRMNYGLSEHQLRRLVIEAQKGEMATHSLLQLIERRLDNVVFRAGLARTIPAARQLVCHGHILVNDRKVDIASYRISPGETIKLKKLKGELPEPRFEAPEWLKTDRATGSAEVTALPDGEASLFPLDMKLVIEHYAKRL